jgi:hypothetical protein
MEPLYFEREQVDDLIDGGQDKRFADSFYGHDRLKLSDSVNMVNRLTFVLTPLRLYGSTDTALAWSLRH